MTKGRKQSPRRKDRQLRNGVAEELDAADEHEESQDQPPRRTFSILGNLIFIGTLAVIIGTGWLIWQTWLPQDLSDLPGYRQADQEINIPQLLRQSYKKNTAITLTEEDLNRYIATTLKASQNGFLSMFAKPHGVGIRLHDGYMEIIIERQVASRFMQTVSLYVTFVQLENPASPIPITNIEYYKGSDPGSSFTEGGTLGRLTVPQGYMLLLLPAFEELVSAYDELLTSILDNGRIIRISKGHIDLLPGQQTF